MKNPEPIDRETWIAELLKDKERTYQALDNSLAMKRRRREAKRLARQKAPGPSADDSHKIE